MREKIIARDNEHLKKLISKEIYAYGENCDLNHIDIRNIKNMSGLFKKSSFNFDISCFNGDISKWDTSHVKNMAMMFMKSKFNGDISKWDTSQVTSMYSMFYASEFNSNISKWNTSSVNTMSYMFTHSHFNQDISIWNTLKTNDMFMMFSNRQIVASRDGIQELNVPYWYGLTLDERKDLFHMYSKIHEEKEIIENSLQSSLLSHQPKKIIKL